MILPRPLRISSITNGDVGGADSATQLWTININTGAGGAILKIFDHANDGTTQGTQQIQIDASSKSSHGFYCTFPHGFHWDLSGGAADVTITYA